MIKKTGVDIDQLRAAARASSKRRAEERGEDPSQQLPTPGEEALWEVMHRMSQRREAMEVLARAKELKFQQHGHILPYRTLQSSLDSHDAYLLILDSLWKDESHGVFTLSASCWACGDHLPIVREGNVVRAAVPCPVKQEDIWPTIIEIHSGKLALVEHLPLSLGMRYAAGWFYDRRFMEAYARKGVLLMYLSTNDARYVRQLPDGFAVGLYGDMDRRGITGPEIARTWKSNGIVEAIDASRIEHLDQTRMGGITIVDIPPGRYACSQPWMMTRPSYSADYCLEDRVSYAIWRRLGPCEGAPLPPLSGEERELSCTAERVIGRMLDVRPGLVQVLGWDQAFWFVADELLGGLVHPTHLEKTSGMMIAGDVDPALPATREEFPTDDPGLRYWRAIDSWAGRLGFGPAMCPDIRPSHFYHIVTYPDRWERSWVRLADRVLESVARHGDGMYGRLDAQMQAWHEKVRPFL